MRRRLFCWCVTLIGPVAACAPEPERAAHQPGVAARHTPVVSSAAAPRASVPSSTVGAAQAFEPPAELRLPATLRSGEQVPLLMILHGFGVSSRMLIAKAGLDQIADQKKFAYLAPQGMSDAEGRPFWNAGKSCCDLEHRGVDDVQRLAALLDESSENAAIDRQRLFVIGYSNGGFMAQRLACKAGDRIAGVISVAGAAPSGDEPCVQHSALSFLEIHGDADPVVHYGGGTVFDRSDVAPHPSALETAKYWARRLGCAGELQSVQNIDLEPFIPARETRVQRYDACRGAVELWTVEGGGHYVALQPPALDEMWTFLTAHPKGGR